VDGFQVDLGALEDAAAGINQVLNDLGSIEVTAIPGARSDFGHDAVADAVGDFCSRWQIGVQKLAADGQQVAVRLSRSVQAYLQVDLASNDRWDGILRRTSGPDPGLRDG
jgi:hypothetical protein